MDLYHALNRGVDKRTIFLDTQDYARFVHDMFIFNTTKPANNTQRLNMVDLRSRPSNTAVTIDETEKLVSIHGWCLMHNHYHLLLSERIEGGIIQFLRKLNIGYAKYFNERYKRTGTLFQGRTKKILIDSDSHFLHILNYIHFNPLDMLEGSRDWRSQRIVKNNNVLEHLKNYRWSSYQDYIGIKNFPSILTISLFNEVFNNDYLRNVENYLQSISIDEINHFTLE